MTKIGDQDISRLGHSLARVIFHDEEVDEEFWHELQALTKDEFALVRMAAFFHDGRRYPFTTDNAEFIERAESFARYIHAPRSQRIRVAEGVVRLVFYPPGSR